MQTVDGRKRKDKKGKTNNRNQSHKFEIIQPRKLIKKQGYKIPFVISFALTGYPISFFSFASEPNLFLTGSYLLALRVVTCQRTFEFIGKT